MFEVGEIVQCIDDSSCACCGDPIGTAKGSYYRISKVDMLRNRLSPELMLGLAFVGVDLCSPNHMFCAFVSALRFRKLERASESFTLSIKRHADEPVS